MMLQMAAIHVPDSGELTAFKSGTIYFVLKMMGWAFPDCSSKSRELPNQVTQIRTVSIFKNCC